MSQAEYEFGEFEDQILKICEKRPIDYGKIKELIAQGADLNKLSKYFDDTEHYWANMLSFAIWEFAMNEIENADCKPKTQEYYEESKNDFLQMIDFFLANGFDLATQSGKYGDQCFRELGNRTEEFVIDAAKKLLKAGAVTVDTNSEDDTLRDLVSDAYYDTAIDGFPEKGNLTFALYKILERARASKPYKGIQNFRFAESGTIKAAYFVNSQEDIKISQKLFLNSSWVCEYDQDLCFELDNCWLYISKYCECYADTEKPIEQLVDVSEHFTHLLGCKIVKIGDFKDASGGDKFMKQKLYGTEGRLNLYYTRKTA